MKAAMKAGRSVCAFIGFVFLISVALVCATVLAEELSDYVRGGMRLAVSAIIPSVFPFKILADFITASIDFSTMPHLSSLFERSFHISRRALAPFIIGTLAGFPVGAKMASELYKSGAISKEDAEACIAISSSPSLAFVVSGVGAAMWGNVGYGVLLYLSVVSASVFFGLISRKKALVSDVSRDRISKFTLLRSVEKATESSLGIIGVISIFSVFSGLILELPASENFAHFILPFFEVGGACAYLAKAALPDFTLLVLTAFSLGFSGLSVHLQIRGAISGTDLSYRRFFIAKALQGALSAAIMSTLLLLANRC